MTSMTAAVGFVTGGVDGHLPDTTRQQSIRSACSSPSGPVPRSCRASVTPPDHFQEFELPMSVAAESPRWRASGILAEADLRRTQAGAPGQLEAVAPR